MIGKNTLAASIQAKKGNLYAVIQVKEDGKRKYMWRTLGLPEGFVSFCFTCSFR